MTTAKALTDRFSFKALAEMLTFRLKVGRHSFKALSLCALLPLAALLWSCSESGSAEPALQEEIQFGVPAVSVSSTEGSRANLVQGKLPAGETFGVMGYCVPMKAENVSAYEATGGLSDWQDKKDRATPDVLDNAPVIVDAAGCYYTDPAKTGVWITSSDPRLAGSAVDPSRLKYTFVAYYPWLDRFGHPRFSVSPASGIGAPTLNYTVIYGQAGLDPHGNDLGSTTNRVERHADATTDAMYAFVSDHVRASGAVDLTFHHIFSGVSVQLNNHNPQPVTVKSVTLDGGFYSRAHVSFAGADPAVTVDSDLYWGTFQFLERSGGDQTSQTPVAVEVPAESSVTAGSTPSKPEGTVVLLLPNREGGHDGTYLGQDKYIRVSATYQGRDITFVSPHFNLGRTPEPGVNYKININFMSDEILILLTTDDVEYWESGSDSDIIIN